MLGISVLLIVYVFSRSLVPCFLTLPFLPTLPITSHFRSSSYFRSLTLVTSIARSRANSQLAWSPDSRFLAVGGQDDLITLFSPREARVVARCQGHSAFVTSIAFDPGRGEGRGYRFASVGEDGKLILVSLELELERSESEREREEERERGRVKGARALANKRMEVGTIMSVEFGGDRVKGRMEGQRWSGSDGKKG